MECLYSYFKSHNITNFRTEFLPILETTVFIDESDITSFHPEKIMVDLMGDFPIIECHFYRYGELYTSILEQDFNMETPQILLLDMILLGIHISG